VADSSKDSVTPRLTTVAVTMATVLVSGLFALRSLRLVQPAELLR
jgi:hypothetical protein